MSENPDQWEEMLRAVLGNEAADRMIEQMGGMSVVLAQAAHDPTLPTITIHYVGPRPDLLKDEAQAIITGSLDENGVFQASELLLKCPSKYQSELPDQNQ